MYHSLFKNVEVRRLTIDGTNYILSAGTSDVQSGSVDTLGYEGVAFVLTCGTIASSGDVTMEIQQSSDDGSTDSFTDLTGTSVSLSADTDDNKMLIVEVFRPTERYLRADITRGDGGNSTIDCLHAFLFRPVNAAVTQGATVEAAEFHVSPAEGTA